MMYLDLFLFLMVFFGIGGAMGVAHLLSLVFDKDKKERAKQLPEPKRYPALPLPRAGPYRDSGETNDSSEEKQSSQTQLDADELFRRYVYAFTRLKGNTHRESFCQLAEALDLSHLMDVIEDAEPDSPRNRAVIHALSIRSNPSDIHALLGLLFESEWTHVPETVLHVLRARGPVNDNVISAVYDIVYAEPDRVEEFDDYPFLKRLAEDILGEWEEKHPDAIRRFVLIK